MLYGVNFLLLCQLFFLYFFKVVKRVFDIFLFVELVNFEFSFFFLYVHADPLILNWNKSYFFLFDVFKNEIPFLLLFLLDKAFDSWIFIVLILLQIVPDTFIDFFMEYSSVFVLFAKYLELNLPHLAQTLFLN